LKLSQGPSYVTPALDVDETKRSPTSIENKDKYGSWDPSTIGDFVPERWLVENDKGELRFDPFAGPAHPFGAGPRGCFGRQTP
jgi:hypothetical protein